MIQWYNFPSLCPKWGWTQFIWRHTLRWDFKGKISVDNSIAKIDLTFCSTICRSDKSYCPKWSLHNPGTSYHRYFYFYYWWLAFTEDVEIFNEWCHPCQAPRLWRWQLPSACYLKVSRTLGNWFCIWGKPIVGIVEEKCRLLTKPRKELKHIALNRQWWRKHTISVLCCT